MASSNEDDPSVDTVMERVVRLGVDLLGAGGGAAIAMGADPALGIIGALTGTSIASVGRDIVTRVLSRRQEARVGAVFLEAGAAIRALEVQGETVRDDDFWQGEHSHGYEFAEGVLLAAVNTYEERKLPYMANLLATVTVSPWIDAPMANHMLHLAERTSWLELCLLSIFAQPDEFPMPEKELEAAKGWELWTVREAFSRLTSIDTGLMSYGRREGGMPGYDLNLSSVKFHNRGTLLVAGMALASIPRADLIPIYESLLELQESTDGDLGDAAGGALEGPPDYSATGGKHILGEEFDSSTSSTP